MTPAKTAYYVQREADSKGAYVKFVDRDRIANTVRAGYGKSRGAEALLRYPDGSMRMLTEVEMARVQSFPEEYVFLGGQTAAYMQIGNAVPPALAYHIGRVIKRHAP
jgi:DNA (cytosine-5)-methyltransferase 1